MTSKDKLFKFYGKGEIPENPDDMVYIMWSEDSVFNFSNYSYAVSIQPLFSCSQK